MNAPLPSVRLGVFTVALALAGCGADATNADAAPEAEASTPSQPTADAVADGASAASTDTEQGEVLALVFGAEWCLPCKVLSPKVSAVAENHLDDLPVTFVSLNQTDEGTRREAEATAHEGGYYDLYTGFEGSTGFILLISADTNEFIDQIVHTDTEEVMLHKFQRAVSRA